MEVSKAAWDKGAQKWEAQKKGQAMTKEKLLASI